MSTSKSSMRPGDKRLRKKGATYHHGDLRRSLLAAALKLLAHEGPTGVTLRGVAKMTGVSQAAPYRHFASREALLAAVATEAFQGLSEAMADGAKAAGDSPIEQFQGMGVAYVGYAARDPFRFRLMFGTDVGRKTDYPELEQAARQSFKQLLDGVVTCQQAGAIRQGATEALALLAWASVHGLAELVIDKQVASATGRVEPAEALAQELTDHLYLGLASSPAGL